MPATYNDLGGLMTQVCGGDTDALEALRILTGSDLTIVLTRLLDNRADVSAVIDDVFATLRRDPGVLDGQADPLAALFALAHRTATTHLERQGKPPRPPEHVGSISVRS